VSELVPIANFNVDGNLCVSTQSLTLDSLM